MVFISKNDEVASYKTSINLFKNMKNVKIIEKNKSNHVLLYDYDSKDIIKKVKEFLEKWALINVKIVSYLSII